MLDMKTITIFKVTSNRPMGEDCNLLTLTPSDGSKLNDIRPGQFVQVEIPDSKTTFLRRPISVNFVDYDANQLWLLVRKAGAGTQHLAQAEVSSRLNVILPLGNGFTMPKEQKRILLIGGGVGIAPLYYLGYALADNGFEVNYLIGARTEAGLLELDLLKTVATRVFVSTDDGSCGEKGLVTHNTALTGNWDMIYCCGPMPMMKAVARYAAKNNIECEVSLENRMACGIGACLCCVEDTDKGNLCVCTHGPVFNIKNLKWEI